MKDIGVLMAYAIVIHKTDTAVLAPARSRFRRKDDAPRFSPNVTGTPFVVE
jgi:hypothetical protein